MPNNLDENQTEQEQEVNQETDIENSNSEVQEVDNRSTETSEPAKSERAVEREKRREARQAAERSDSDFKQKYDNLAKEYQNFRGLTDRQLNELRQAQLSTEDRKLIKEIQDLKRKSELEGLKKSNPDEYNKRITQDLIDERLNAQNQNQNQQVNQGNQFNQEQSFTPEQFNQMGNYAQNTLISDPEIGQRTYKLMEPEMVNVLKNVESPTYRAVLLQNPRVLFHMAVGQAYMRAETERVRTSAAATKKANTFHEGTAKTNSNGRKTVDFSSLSDKELEKLKNEELMKQFSN